MPKKGYALRAFRQNRPLNGHFGRNSGLGAGFATHVTTRMLPTGNIPGLTK
jgi:hypothetical protein